jgi:hypothetical protein
MADAPTVLERVLKAEADVIAPTFPDAAEMPQKRDIGWEEFGRVAL